MASASAAALSWRPLLLRPSSPSRAAGERARISVASTFPSSTPRACCCGSGGGLSSFAVRNSLSSPFLDARLESAGSNSVRMKRRGYGAVTTRAGMRLDPGGGKNNGDGGIGRVVANLAFAGGLTYLTVTGKLGWIFDTLVSLWLLAVLIPIVSFVAFLWFAEREIVKGACPNCGQAFQVFEFAVKQQPNLCPYCSQPFKLDSDRQFVRDEPRFSNERSGGFRNGFGGFGDFSRQPSGTKNSDPGGVIVDVEAEVVDRD